MKVPIAAILVVVGLILLGVGYSTGARGNSEIKQRHERFEVVQDSERHDKDKSEQVIQQQEMIEDLSNTMEEQAYATRGAIQYCTGWLLVAAAGIVFSSGRNEKSVPMAE